MNLKTKQQYRNKLIEGETLEILQSLPDKIVDLGITSPPYNKKEKNKGWLVKNVVYSQYRDKVPEKEYQANQIEVLNEIYRITKNGESFFTITRSDGKTGKCFTLWIG